MLVKTGFCPAIGVFAIAGRFSMLGRSSIVFTVGSVVCGAANIVARVCLSVVPAHLAVGGAAAVPPAWARSCGGVMAGTPSSAAFVVAALTFSPARAGADAFFSGGAGPPPAAPALWCDKGLLGCR